MTSKKQKKRVVYQTKPKKGNVLVTAMILLAIVISILTVIYFSFN